MPGSPDTLTKNFRDSEFFRPVDLPALNLESGSARVFPDASRQVKDISALVAHELTAYRSTASTPVLFTNRKRDELPKGPTLPRWITSFLYLTQNTHCCIEAVRKDNSGQQA